MLFSRKEQTKRDLIHDDDDDVDDDFVLIIENGNVSKHFHLRQNTILLCLSRTLTRPHIGNFVFSWVISAPPFHHHQRRRMHI
jgi:hypothetical protein